MWKIQSLLSMEILWHPTDSPERASPSPSRHLSPIPSQKKSWEGQAAINQKCFGPSLFHTAADAFRCPVLFYVSFIIHHNIQMSFPNLKFLQKDPCLKQGEHLKTTWVGGQCGMKLISFYPHLAQILEFSQMQTNTVIIGKGYGKMI